MINLNRPRLTSFIIVNWNTRDLTARCLSSIVEKNKEAPVEIFVVDNASTDGSVEFIAQKFPAVKMICNEQNLGFAKANNQAIRRALGDLIILLNSDTELLSPEPAQRIHSFLQTHPKVGIVGAKLLLPNGQIQSLGREFVSLKTLIKTQLLFSSSPALSRSIAQSPQSFLHADYVDGAFLAIRRVVVDQIGLMNEQYFMYVEDMEWCASAHKAGWEVAVLPDIEVVHYHAASAVKDFPRILFVNAVNISRYIGHTNGWQQAKASFYVLMAGMLLRIPLSLFRKRKLAVDYWRGFWKCFGLIGRLESVLKRKTDGREC